MSSGERRTSASVRESLDFSQVRRNPRLTPDLTDRVSATSVGERSSRSHSIFAFRISEKSPASGDSCEGSLNFVNLAGSEQLEKSGAGNDKDRLKDTQNIDESSSTLGEFNAASSEKRDGKRISISCTGTLRYFVHDPQMHRPVDDECDS